MSAEPGHRRQLGELLVEQGVITDAQLALALTEQQASGQPLGEVLVRLGFTQGPTVGNALAEQYGGPLRTEYGLALGPTASLGLSLRKPDDGVSAPIVEPPTGGLRVADAQSEKESPADRTEASEPRPGPRSSNPDPEELQAELERVRYELSVARDERARSKAQISDLGRELAEVRAAKGDVAAGDLEALQAALAQSRDDLESARNELLTAHKERAESQAQVDDLRLELARARTAQEDVATGQLQAAEAALVQSEDKLERARSELETAQEERARSQARAVDLERELARAQESETEASARLESTDELQAAFDLLERELAQASAANEALGHELMEARGAGAEHAVRIGDLERELEEARADREGAEAADRSRAEFEAAADRNRAELGTATAALEDAIQERDALARRLAGVEERHRVELAAASAADRARRRAIDDTKEAFAEVRRALDRQKAGLSELVERRSSSWPEKLDEAKGSSEGLSTQRFSVRELELVLAEHKAELATIAAGLARSGDASLDGDPEEAGNAELVAAARARAERRYAPALRVVADLGAADGEPGAVDDPVDAPRHVVQAGGGITIRLWQLALFVVLAPALVYVLLPLSVPAAAAAIVVLTAALFAEGRRSGRARRAG